jgi:hypothetical protein
MYTGCGICASYDFICCVFCRFFDMWAGVIFGDCFTVTSHKQQTKNTTRQQMTRSLRRKWATFTYVGKETYHITNIIRHADIQIAFRTNSTIQNLLTQRKPNPDKF